EQASAPSPADALPTARRSGGPRRQPRSGAGGAHRVGPGASARRLRRARVRSLPRAARGSGTAQVGCIPGTAAFPGVKELLDSLWTTPRAALSRSGRTVYLVSAPKKPQLEGWSYCGEVWTDARGRAVAALPPFAHNHRAGFHYELTPVG